jgi:hypothetical protein
MTLEKSVTDDQLGKYYRRVNAIVSRLGKSLSYSDVMDALQHLHDGTLRLGLNTAEDLQQLLQRPLGAEAVLTTFQESEIQAFPTRSLKDCFANKNRYPRGFDTSVSDGRYISWPEVIPEQEAGRVRVFKMKGMASYAMLAAELLQVSNETPVSWLQQLLVKRGHTLTLSAIEGIIELHTEGNDLGLAPPPRHNNRSFHPGNLAFVEVKHGVVDVIHFNRKSSKRWDVSRYPFDQNGGRSSQNDRHLVTRA